MKFYSDFQKDKTYNYKTFILDGDKVAHEVNIKYLFDFTEGSQMTVEQFFFDKTFMKYYKEKGIKPNNKCDFFLVSCIPWMSYTSFDVNNQRVNLISVTEALDNVT